MFLEEGSGFGLSRAVININHQLSIQYIIPHSTNFTLCALTNPPRRWTHATENVYA